MRNELHRIPKLGLFLLATLSQAAFAVEPQVSIQDAQTAEGDAGTNALDFSVSRSDDTGSNLVIEYRTAVSDPKSAAAGEDYEPIERGVLRLPAGSAEGTIGVDILGDTLAEPDETFVLQLEHAMAFNPTPDFVSSTPLGVGAFPTSIAIGDIDGDGRQDLVTADHGANSFSLLLNRSTANSASFAEAQTIAPGLPGPRAVAIGDLNGDGKSDIVGAIEYEDRVLIAPNAGGGDFSGAHAIDIRGGPYAVAIGDLDGDGQPEVVAANSATAELSILRNIASNGAVGFESVRYIPVGNFPHAVGIADLDGDGLGDVAVVNSADNSIAVLRSTGALGFAPTQTYAAGAGAEGLAIGDVTGDGKADLVVANAYSGNISVLRNASSPGAVSFDPAQHFAAADGPYTAAIADINGDGKPDVVVSAFGADGVAVLANTSTAAALSFGAPQVFATDNGPYAVAVGNLDGDGKADLAVVNADANSVSVLRNSPNFVASLLDNEGVGTIVNDDGGIPAQFRFRDRTGVARNTRITSNNVRIQGLAAPARITVSAGTYSIGCVARNFTAEPGLIRPGQRVCVRHVSASVAKTATNTVLTIGGVSDTFTSTTR